MNKYKLSEFCVLSQHQENLPTFPQKANKNFIVKVKNVGESQVAKMYLVSYCLLAILVILSEKVL